MRRLLCRKPILIPMDINAQTNSSGHAWMHGVRDTIMHKFVGCDFDMHEHGPQVGWASLVDWAAGRLRCSQTCQTFICTFKIRVHNNCKHMNPGAHTSACLGGGVFCRA
uniref:Uncharacterized protein n=1 Tax=Eutreptiella gymnastica TaxID=73025 RepID=A0A6U8I830_9EUGL